MRRRDEDEDDLEIGQRFGAPENEPDTWTPTLVGRALVMALRIARSTAGATHPKQYGSGMPAVVYTKDDIADMAKEDLRRPPSAADITRADAALFWQSRYLADWDPEYSQTLKVWLRCKTHKISFAKECDRRGWSRATRYRYRDRALALISVGLDADLVPIWRA